MRALQRQKLLNVLNAAKRLVNNPFNQAAQRSLVENTRPRMSPNDFSGCIASCESCPLGMNLGAAHFFCTSTTTEEIKEKHMEGIFVLRLLEFIAMIESQLENLEEQHEPNKCNI
jgi:hypothetical protein